MGNNNSILNKFDCLSVEESAVDQPQTEMEARPQKRWLCNELVWELCKEIPIVKTSDRILLTAHKMYAYLAPRFSKKLVYRDAIAFLKTALKVNNDLGISIIRVAQSNESDPIVVINQKLWYHESTTIFELVTNKFQVHIWTKSYYKSRISIIRQFKCAHLDYFLRLVTPLLQPVQLCLRPPSGISIKWLVRFMHTQRDWIDSIALSDQQFNSVRIYGALFKYNKMQIDEAISPSNVPKLIQFLTSNNNNNGQTKKQLFLGQYWINDGLALLIDELKMEFARATNKCRFVVRLILRQQLDEFNLCNELTGEKLQLSHKNIGDERYMRYIHALSRSPDNGLDANENYLKLYGNEMMMAQIFLH